MDVRRKEDAQATPLAGKDRHLGYTVTPRLAACQDIYAMRNGDQAPDEIDQELVRQLQQDGRRSYREMARSLEVSEGTVAVAGAGA